MATKTNDFTYLKYGDNFLPYKIALIDPFYYKVGRKPIPYQVPATTQRIFQCDSGKVWYIYSHFPNNCGVGVYSGITALTAGEKVSERTRLFREFIHFMRNSCDKDMILLSDNVDGIIAEMADESDGQLCPIGRKVLNNNSDNHIKMYQTTRQSAAHEIYFEIESIHPELLGEV